MSQIHGVPYERSLEEAEQRGETKLLWDSYNSDTYCMIAMEEAIRRNWDGSHLSSVGIMRVIREYGLERVERLLANTIQKSGKDECFSEDNKEWAETIHVPEYKFHGYDLWREQMLSSDPALLNLTVNTVRKEREWRTEHEKEEKPSIRVQLAIPKTPVAAVGEANRKYGREER